MTTPPQLKIRDPMKYPPKSEDGCCSALKYVFCGRKVKKIEAKDTNLTPSPARVDIGEHLKKETK